MHFLSDFFFTLVIILLSFTSITGVGYLSSLALKLKNDECVFYFTFFGIAISILLLSIINFFLPINFYISFIIFTIGSIAFFKIKANNFLLLRLPKTDFISIVLLIFPFFWILKSMDIITSLDSAGYHLGFIKWINEYPIVGGLGNLVTGFANNNSWFLLVAFLNFSPIFENGSAIAGFFILLLASLLIFFKRNNIPYPNILLPIFFVSIIFNTYRLSSPSPDLAVNILTIVIFFLLIEIVHLKQKENIRFNIFLIISLCITLITIKLSGATFACLILAYLFFSFRKIIPFKDKLLIIVFIFVLFSPHLIRGYFISGYPLFPLTFGALFEPVWKMELKLVESHSDVISCWAKNVYELGCSNFYNFDWIKKWISKVPFEIIFYLLISIILFFCCLIKFKLKIKKNNFLLLTLIPFLSLIIWFIKAPDPRFAISMIMIFLGCSICLFSSYYNIKLKYLFDRNKMVSLIFLSILISSLRFSTISIDNLRYILKNGYFLTPSPNYIETYVNDGFTLNIPKNSECYNIKLPCSRNFKKGLNLVYNKSGFPKLYFFYDIEEQYFFKH